MITIESVTAERLAVEITTTGDPSAVLPSFAIGQGADPGTFTNGSWASTWDSSSGKITALTPNVGTGQPLNVTSGDWRLYCKWSVGTEQPVRIAALIRVT